MKQILSKSFADILSADVLFFAVKIALGALALTAVLTWKFWGMFSSLIASYLSWIPWEWLQTSGASVATLSLSYMIFIIITSLLTSLYSEKLLIKLAQKHYPQVSVIGSANISTSVILTLKASLVFLVLFIMALPFLFIPILGQVVLLYLLSILIKEPTTYDVGSLFIKEKKILKQKSKKMRLLAMTGSLLHYIPILNIFAPIFTQILFLHYLLGNEKR